MSRQIGRCTIDDASEVYREQQGGMMMTAKETSKSIIEKKNVFLFPRRKLISSFLFRNLGSQVCIVPRWTSDWRNADCNWHLARMEFRGCRSHTKKASEEKGWDRKWTARRKRKNTYFPMIGLCFYFFPSSSFSSVIVIWDAIIITKLGRMGRTFLSLVYTDRGAWKKNWKLTPFLLVITKRL